MAERGVKKSQNSQKFAKPPVPMGQKSGQRRQRRCWTKCLPSDKSVLENTAQSLKILTIWIISSNILIKCLTNEEEKNQNRMFSCPMIGQCQSDCPIVGQCMSNCPMVGHWMSNCPIIGQCTFNCMKVGQRLSNCPIVGQCMSSCLMILLCMSNCSLIGQWILSCPMIEQRIFNFIKPSPMTTIYFTPAAYIQTQSCTQLCDCLVQTEQEFFIFCDISSIVPKIHRLQVKDMCQDN